MIVRCETCHVVMDPTDAHDTFDADGDGQLHYWCFDCCPSCDLALEQLSLPLDG